MRTVHRFATLDSTMTKAAEIAAEGAQSGTVIVADQQTAGQGRLGRSWHSEPASGLYMTVILRPKLCPDSLPVVTLVLGLATAEALAEIAGVACDLRWPNDVLIGNRKCAGILAQLHDGVLLAGIGINVNHASFPDDIAVTATSLRQSTGRVYSREKLMDAVLDRIDEQVETLMRDGKEPVLRAFTEASSYVRGRRVIVDQGDESVTGTTDGLNSQGFLWVREDNGRRRLILAGGVRPICS
jgi:BirA family biotin operon repressor/biotin-[acetyl-CoA-carboxylase] ligase